MRRTFSGFAEIDEWMNEVVDGTVPACHEQHQVVDMVRVAFETEDINVDEPRLRCYMGYQRYFPFDLDDWEKFLVGCWLCTYKADGRPRWSELFMLVGRGNGKNGFISFVSFCLLSKANGIRNYNIDITANTEQQAMTSQKALVDNVFEANPAKMRKGFDWTKTYVRNKSTASEMHYYSNSPKNRDGLRPGLAALDEFHGQTDNSNFSVFLTALGKVPDGRILESTTDGHVRDGALDDIKKRAKVVLDGDAPDGGFLPFICKLERKEQVHDERNWHMANPHLRFAPDLLDQIRREYAAYRINPLANADFLTKRMNLPVGRPDVQVTTWENLMAASRDFEPIERGASCVVGIDYARTQDMIGAALLNRADDGTYRVLEHSWICTHSRDFDAIKAPLGEWADGGFLTVVDDDEVTPDEVCRWVYDMSLEYDVKCVAMDDYRETLFKRALSDIGYSVADKTVWRIRPSDIMKTQPIIDSAFNLRRIAWGERPDLRWFANNAKLVPAPNGNFKYDKIEPKSRKTDGFMAIVHAFAVADKLPTVDEPAQFLPVITI